MADGSRTAPGEDGLRNARRTAGQKRVIVAVVGVIVLLAGVGYVLWVTRPSPTSTVKAFFGALADRDADAALEMIPPDIADGIERAVINDRVLGSDGYAPPLDVKVVRVTTEGHHAVVDVAYTVSGHALQFRREASLRLRRGGDGTEWRILNGIGWLAPSEAPKLVGMAGEDMGPPPRLLTPAARVEVYDAQGPRRVPALPGGYRVAALHPLLQPAPGDVVVGPGDTAELDVPLVMQVSGTRFDGLGAPAPADFFVELKVTEFLNDCVAELNRGSVPAGCPDPGHHDQRVVQLGPFSAAIAEVPALEMSLELDASGDARVHVESVTDGELARYGLFRRDSRGVLRTCCRRRSFSVSGHIDERGRFVPEHSDQ